MGAFATACPRGATCMAWSHVLEWILVQEARRAVQPVFLAPVSRDDVVSCCHAATTSRPPERSHLAAAVVVEPCGARVCEQLAPCRASAPAKESLIGGLYDLRALSRQHGGAQQPQYLWRTRRTLWRLSEHHTAHAQHPCPHGTGTGSACCRSRCAVPRCPRPRCRRCRTPRTRRSGRPCLGS